MTPIEAPTILQYGIALYAPPLVGDENAVLRLEVFYGDIRTERCGTSNRLWIRESGAGKKGTLFLWRRDEPLVEGRYTLQLTSFGKVRSSGTTSVEFLEPTDRWVVGLPYSIYPPISL